MSAFIIFPLVIGLAVVAKPLVLALLTEKWLGAVSFIQIFCMAYLLMPMQIANIQAIQALGYSGKTLKLEIKKKVIELIILVITVPISVHAIAWGIVLYNAVCLFINTRPNKELLGYGVIEQIKDVAPILLINILMGAITYMVTFLELSALVTLFIQCGLGVSIYLLLSFLFKLETFKYIRDLIRPKLRNFIK